VFLPTASSETTESSRRKYSQSILPHYVERYGYYSRWIDFTLKIHNVTQRDTGLYTFEITSPHGYVQEHHIYVDLPLLVTNVDVKLRRMRHRQRRRRHRLRQQNL
jgi:Natural killer cell receptor 2B4